MYQLSREGYTAIIEQTKILNPEAIILNKFDAAITGRTGGPHPVLIYDMELCIQLVMRDQNCKYTDAQEWLEYNTFYVNYGRYGPIFYNNDPTEQADSSHYGYGYEDMEAYSAEQMQKP